MMLPGLDLAYPPVAVLFARADSIYKKLPGCDVYDIERDARNFADSRPVIAHPPCRAWGRLRAFAKPRHDEKELAFLAVHLIRRNGGVLEHPAASSLWPAAGLPVPGTRDAFGGYTLPVSQKWWGHRAEKLTYLYIVGIEPSDLPAIPYSIQEASHTVGLWSGRDRQTCRPEISKPEREATPPELARWLFEVAVSSTTATKSTNADKTDI